jgi:hypothetical protein
VLKFKCQIPVPKGYMLWPCALLEQRPLPVFCDFRSVFLGGICVYTFVWYLVSYAWLAVTYDFCFWSASFASWQGNSLLWMRHLGVLPRPPTNTKVVPWNSGGLARPHFFPFTAHVPSGFLTVFLKEGIEFIASSEGWLVESAISWKGCNRKQWWL